MEKKIAVCKLTKPLCGTSQPRDQEDNSCGGHTFGQASGISVMVSKVTQQAESQGSSTDDGFGIEVPQKSSLSLSAVVSFPPPSAKWMRWWSRDTQGDPHLRVCSFRFLRHTVRGKEKEVCDRNVLES
ncbi:hypothetical protein NPIL_507451 [Nephila pilipes]|uniref:Uncharacterized protein n=1 Tax=Nephila pilipes TaxID=299642 RepID=A0A8X6MIC2_NEPPI|nr:hypothetical protein NPIL_507451 [Nephila pilipes]